MTRMSMIPPLAALMLAGCTGDLMGLRSTYRDRSVSPWVNPQPISNSPVALQPTSPMGPNGQPITAGPTAYLPQSTINNMSPVDRARMGWNTPYPMLASAGGQLDGRAYPYVTRQAMAPGSGGARHRKAAISNTVRIDAIAGPAACAIERSIVICNRMGRKARPTVSTSPTMSAP